MSGDQPIVVEDRGPVRWIWFNRPEVHNAQDTAMLEALTDALVEVEREEAVRALVLAGRGSSFCSGHDLREIAVSEAYRKAAETVEGRMRWEERLFVRPVQLLQALPIPTLARVQGHCLAAGLMFASSTDLSVAADNAVFGSRIIPAMSINDAEVPAFAWLVGERRAKQALWLGEEIRAEEALRLGLVNWVVPAVELDAFIENIMTRLGQVAPEILALSKASFRFLAERQGRGNFSTFHFLSHSLSHHTTAAKSALAARVERIASGVPPLADKERIGPGANP